MISSIDTCFLIDWCRYSKRGVLEKIFDYCFIVDDVLREIKSDESLAYVSSLLSKGFLVFYPFKSELEPIVRRIIDLSVGDPRIRVLDPPEAYAFAIGIRENTIVLTENNGVLNLVRLYSEFSSIRVWRSFELLREAYKRGLINNFEDEVKIYERETGHRFPKIPRG
ncbi:MAG: DNA-binding protein [Candidatus Methanomethylicia archaeon]